MCKKMIAAMTAVSIFLTLILSILPFATLTVVAVDTEAALKTAIAANQNITLTDNITISSWTSTAYSGTLNGDGYVISGLKTPLISTLTGTVKNLGLAAGGSFSGTALLATKMTSGAVSSCFAYGDLKYTGTGNIGGLIATLQGGTVSDSFSCVNITATKSAYCGGLIGRITAGTVSSCYSSGTIDCTIGKVAGFANQTGGTVSDTYTTCQIKNEYIQAKASGVNGIYDNQLGIVRESVENKGLKTTELMNTTSLSADHYAVTSSSYPSLLAFYDSSSLTWTPKVRHIVRVSTAAASVEDVDPAQRKEPQKNTFYARMDYLTPSTYVTKTNVMSLYWSVDSDQCKIYDVVPTTTAVDANGVSNQPVSTNADLLKAKFVFSSNVNDAKLTAASGGYTRNWYLTSYNKNPYFEGGDGNTSTTYFQVNSVAQLDKVRYYSLIGAAYYNLTATISSVGEFDPIEHFIGTFDGKSKTLSKIVLKNNDSKCIGLFGSTQNGAVIKNMRLKDVTLKDNATNAVVGGLVGKANKATLTNVMVYGGNSVLKSTGYCGGLVGLATGCTIKQALVSVAVEAAQNCGGLIGRMDGGTLAQSGSTGYIIGTKNVGGLVGAGVNTAKVDNSFSTASVFSTASGSSVSVGGLVGNASSTTVQNGFYAGLVDAPSATSGVGPLVGSGTPGSNLFYDHTIMNDSTQSGGKNTDEIVGTDLSSLSSSYWALFEGFYPQLQFCDTTALAHLAATPIYLQNHWNENVTKDMTTGWIAQKSDKFAFNSIAPLETINEGAVQYTVNDGYGIEANSGVRRVVYVAKNNDIGIRTIAAVRDDLQTLTFTLGGVDNVVTHLEIYYSIDDGDTWLGYQTIVKSSSDSKPLLYDIPKDCKIKVDVHTEDEYALKAVTLNNDVLLPNADGEYISKQTFSENINVEVLLEDVTPPWGIRVENY